MNKLFVCTIALVGCSGLVAVEKTSPTIAIRTKKSDSGSELAGSYSKPSVIMGAVAKLKKTTPKKQSKQDMLLSLTEQEKKMFSCDSILEKIKVEAIESYITEKKDCLKNIKSDLKNILQSIKTAIKKGRGKEKNICIDKLSQFFTNMQTQKIITQDQLKSINDSKTREEQKKACLYFIKKRREDYKKIKIGLLAENFEEIPKRVLEKYFEESVNILCIKTPMTISEKIKNDPAEAFTLYRKFCSDTLQDQSTQELFDFDDEQNILVTTILNDQFKKL